jgi:hypothetical protein
MMMLVLAIGLYAQMLLPPQQAYTQEAGELGRLVLAAPDGRYAVGLGYNCDAIGIGQNVEFWRSDFNGQGVLAPLDVDGRVAMIATAPDGTVQNLMCSVAIELLPDSPPCAANAMGTCDVALESSP